MNVTFSRVVSRALIAGLITGVLMGAYMYFVVEPTVGEAIALEESLAELASSDPGAVAEEPLFDRVQQTAGGVAANVIYAVVVGAVFGVVFAKFRHRLPSASDRKRAMWLAAVGFAAVGLVPALKYPANPPAVGDPDTVNERTVQYLVLLVVSVAAAIALTRLAGVLRGRLAEHTRAVAVAAATVLVYGVIMVVLPGTPDSIAAEVPADLVWDFRIRSLGSLVLLWAGLGLGLGWLLERDGAIVPDDDRALASASP